jgi:hypothetical protein
MVMSNIGARHRRTGVFAGAFTAALAASASAALAATVTQFTPPFDGGNFIPGVGGYAAESVSVHVVNPNRVTCTVDIDVLGYTGGSVLVNVANFSPFAIGPVSGETFTVLSGIPQGTLTARIVTTCPKPTTAADTALPASIQVKQPLSTPPVNIVIPAEVQG